MTLDPFGLFCIPWFSKTTPWKVVSTEITYKWWLEQLWNSPLVSRCKWHKYETTKKKRRKTSCELCIECVDGKFKIFIKEGLTKVEEKEESKVIGKVFFTRPVYRAYQSIGYIWTCER